MADEVFIEGRKPAVLRGLVEKATEAGVGLDAIRVVQGGYMVPAELGDKPEPKPEPKQTPKRRGGGADKSDADEGEN